MKLTFEPNTSIIYTYCVNCGCLETRLHKCDCNSELIGKVSFKKNEDNELVINKHYITDNKGKNKIINKLIKTLEKMKSPKRRIIMKNGCGE